MRFQYLVVGVGEWVGEGVGEWGKGGWNQWQMEVLFQRNLLWNVAEHFSLRNLTKPGGSTAAHVLTSHIKICDRVHAWRCWLHHHDFCHHTDTFEDQLCRKSQDCGYVGLPILIWTSSTHNLHSRKLFPISMVMLYISWSTGCEGVEYWAKPTAGWLSERRSREVSPQHPRDSECKKSCKRSMQWRVFTSQEVDVHA